MRINDLKKITLSGSYDISGNSKESYNAEVSTSLSKDGHIKLKAFKRDNKYSEGNLGNDSNAVGVAVTSIIYGAYLAYTVRGIKTITGFASYAANASDMAFSSGRKKGFETIASCVACRYWRALRLSCCLFQRSAFSACN